MNRPGGPREIDPAIFLLQDGGQRGLAVVLRGWLVETADPFRKTFAYRQCTQCAQSLRELARRLVSADLGRELLEPTFMKDAGKIVEQHHERLDGSGYPFGLSGEAVMIESYIVAVADTYDAMTTDRPYRKALLPEVAFAELERYSGIHYPSEVVRAFASAIKRVGFSV